MLRTIGGVLAASLAAPYLASFFIFVLMALLGGSRDANLLFGAPSFADSLLDFLKFLVIGTLGLGMFGLPILFAAGILAFLLHAFALRSKYYAIASGGILGCLSLALLFGGDRDDDRIFFLSGMLAGAICGWIYWRIAITNRARSMSSR